jgi:hypothetical protein
MTDVAMDRPAQVEPVAAPPRQIAPRQPRPQALGKLCGGCMGLLDLFGVGHLAEIDFGEIVGARGAFPPALATALLRRVVGRRQLVGGGFAADRLGVSVLQAFQ